MIGKKILHYQILERLGQGGMGVVYLAEDTKLERLVAIKYLPHHVAANSDERKRFEIEAKAAAALNHPNIATIYAIEEVDDEIFIVMEYIEGLTLREKFKNERLKTKDIIDYTMQMGATLQAAHEKGIIHRDIKSENIMVTRSGQIKVMDFGLAKFRDSTQFTQIGTTLGTAAYMSPEQAKGEAVDHRTDIWSFGVVLYEMLTGELPFKGDYGQAVTYAIINEEPQQITTSPTNVNQNIVNLILQCLKKNPNERYQEINEILIELRRNIERKPRVVDGSKHDSYQNNSGLVFKRKPVFLISLVLVTSIVASLLIWFISKSSLPELNPNLQISELPIPAMEYHYPGISTDGKWLAFPGADQHGNWDIYMMSIKTGETKRITTDSTPRLERAATARFSPDGSSIAYARRNPSTHISEICMVSILSGQVHVLADSGVYPEWNPSGDHIYYYRGIAYAPSRSGWREYWSVSPKEGESRIEFIDSLMHKGSLLKYSFGVSPDGKKIAFTRPLNDTYNEIFIKHLETGEETKLTNDKKTIDEVEWASNGLIFYTSDKSGYFNIWAITESDRKALQITRGTNQDYGISISPAANRIIFLQRKEVGTLWMVGTDGTGNHQVFSDENIISSHLASDANTIALEVSHPKVENTLILRDISGGSQEMIFPFDSLIARTFPQWSPNGKFLAYNKYRKVDDQQTVEIMELKNRRIRNLGKGMHDGWVSDSVLGVIRNPKLVNSPLKLLNLNTSEESLFFRDSLYAFPVLDNTAIFYIDNNDWKGYLLPMSELNKNPKAKGKFVLNFTEASVAWSTFTWHYIRLKNTGTLWRISYKTLKWFKIIDIPLVTKVNFLMPDHNDQFITYTKIRLKTNILIIDNLFVEN